MKPYKLGPSQRLIKGLIHGPGNVFCGQRIPQRAIRTAFEKHLDPMRQNAPQANQYQNFKEAYKRL